MNLPTQINAQYLHSLMQKGGDRIAYSKFWTFLMGVVLSVFVSFGVMNPQSSWDVLGYTGSALTLAGVDDVHGETYSLVKSALVNNGTPADFNLLVQDNPQGRVSTYRSTTAQDSAAFAQQLPYYMIRPAYIALLAGGYQLGLNPMTTMHMLGVLSCFWIGLLVYTRFRQGMSPLLSFIMTSALLLIFRLPSFSGFLSPDPIVAALFICFVFKFEKGLSPLAVAAFVAILVVFRSNAVIFTTPLLLVGFIAHLIQAPMTRLNLKQAVGIFTLSILMMKLIEFWAGNYGWWVLFSFTFIESMNYPAEFNGAFDFGAYFNAVVSGARWLLSDRYTTSFYVFMALMLMHFLIGPWHEKKQNLILFFLMLLVIFVGYFVLFPALFLRFHFSVFTLAGVFAIVGLHQGLMNEKVSRVVISG